MKSELLENPLIIDRARRELGLELNIEENSSGDSFGHDPMADNIKILLVRLLDEKYKSQIFGQLKRIIYLIYYNITSESEKHGWNIHHGNGNFIIDSLPIYNSTKRCLHQYDSYSVIDLQKGIHFLDMIFVLNIYLYLNEDRIDKLGSSFYNAPPPRSEDTHSIHQRLSNLVDGVFPTILINNELNNITEREMLEQAVRRNLEKQNKSKKKENDMDEEARMTHKIFRLHNLGEHFSNFNEEQSYLEGDNINRSPVNQDEVLGTGHLDESEADQMTDEYAEEPEN